MPKAYTSHRDSLVRRGVPYDEAQSRAAAAYNKKNPSAPVTAKYEARHSGRALQRKRQMKKKA